MKSSYEYLNWLLGMNFDPLNKLSAYRCLEDQTPGPPGFHATPLGISFGILTLKQPHQTIQPLPPKNDIYIVHIKMTNKHSLRPPHPNPQDKHLPPSPPLPRTLCPLSQALYN
jgi:hypothetical protein